MRVFPSKAPAITRAPKCASAPSTRALAPGIPCSMRFFRSSGPTPHLPSVDARIEGRNVAQAAGRVELAVGVRVDLGRVARTGERPIRDGERPDALEIQRVGLAPDAHDAQTGVGLHAPRELDGLGRVVPEATAIGQELEAGAAIASRSEER